MRAELVDQSAAPFGVAKGQQALRQQLHANRRGIVLPQFVGQQGRNPVAAKHPAHRCARPRVCQQIVLVAPEHVPISGANRLTFARLVY